MSTVNFLFRDQVLVLNLVDDSTALLEKIKSVICSTLPEVQVKQVIDVKSLDLKLSGESFVREGKTPKMKTPNAPYFRLNNFKNKTIQDIINSIPINFVSQNLNDYFGVSFDKGYLVEM